MTSLPPTMRQHSDARKKKKTLQQASSGMIGLETSLALGITKLVHEGYLPMMKLLEKMTVNPANLYQLPGGRLAEGGPADIVIFDPERKMDCKRVLFPLSQFSFCGRTVDRKGKIHHLQWQYRIPGRYAVESILWIIMLRIV